MTDAAFHLRFEGGDANDHQIDLKLLAQALTGADRIISDAIFVAFEGRLPRQREKPPLVLRVKEPRAGCFDITGIVAAAPGVLPFVHDVFISYASNYIATSLAFVLQRLGGRTKQADVSFDKLLGLTERIVEDYRHGMDAERASSLAHGEQLLRLADKLHPSARQVVAPLGPSCETLILRGSDGSTAEIDVPMADAIRAKEPMEVGDMARMLVRVDGLVLSQRTLRVELLDQPGRIVSADVRDPAFDATPNIYTASIGASLAVDAKPTYRKETGELVRLHIMNATAP